VIDDHALIAESLAHALRELGYDATGMQPASLTEVVNGARDCGADVVLLDLDLGAIGSALPAIPPLREQGCDVIVVTGETSRARWGACIEAGASTVIPKGAGFEALLERLTASMAGIPAPAHEREELLRSLREQRREQDERLAPFARLSPREVEVLGDLMAGRAADEIAQARFVSLATVRSHIRAILQKLGVNSQLAAVALARRCEWSAND
jgi:DNA-binding NarL/FixJ family response regulator